MQSTIEMIPGMPEFADVVEGTGQHPGWLNVQAAYCAPSRASEEYREAERSEAFAKMPSIFAKAFKDHCGQSAIPAEWRLVVLRKWWMRETKIQCDGEAFAASSRVVSMAGDEPLSDFRPSECGEMTAYFIDSTFRFEKA